MLELGPFKKDGPDWVSYGQGIAVCDDSRKRIMPDLDTSSSYMLRFYDKKPRCKVMTIIVNVYSYGKHFTHGWKEDRPNRKWKNLGSLAYYLISDFQLYADNPK